MDNQKHSSGTSFDRRFVLEEII